MPKLNKHKNNIKKSYHDNVRLPLRMVIYKTVSREELTQYSKRDTNLAQNRYIKYGDVGDELYTVKNVQNNNNFVQTNINFDSAKPYSVHDMFNKPIKNKVNLQFENVISKNHSLKLNEKKIIKESNVYNAVDLLKINKHELYHQTKFEMNHVLFGLNEKISEDNTILKQNDDFNTLEEKNTSITSTLQHQQFFNTKHFMNGLHLLGIFNRMENEGELHNFIQFKLLAPDGIKKCQNINNEEKNGQTIILDKYNSRDFSILMNSLKTFNHMKMKKNENLNNLNIFFNNINHNKEAHNKALAIFNSRLNNK